MASSAYLTRGNETINMNLYIEELIILPNKLVFFMIVDWCFDDVDMCKKKNRSDLYGGTTSRTLRALSLLLIAMTGIVLLRQGMSFIGC